ncbi:MAG: AAA family ATPase, partial [Spirochaetota bacterium]|nr:AAA family ATPase [Spirochaetota bacterium]
MKRNIHTKLLSILKDTDKNEVIIIEGARQVGKSYLVNSVLEELKAPYLAFDLEKNSKIRRQIENTEDFEDFKTLMVDQYQLKDNSILFIDEAQESVKLASYVKSMKEDWPQIKVILTGSSMNRFFSKETRIPVGRTKSLCVYSFSFTEFLRFSGNGELAEFIHSAPLKIPKSRHTLLLELYDQYLKVGGYPEAVKAYTSGDSYYEVIDEIMAGLEEDFSRKEEYQPYLFADVIRAVSGHIGSLSKYSHIDTSKYNARKIIEAMKSWHIILEVQHFSLDPHRSNFLPKRYLHDLGVINRKRVLAAPTISILDTIDPALRTPLGGLFENAVLLNLLEGGSASSSISTWKKNSKSDIEVDFILDSELNQIKIPIECKASLR